MNISELIASGSTAWLPAVDVMLKATLVLAAASIATLSLSRASAALRHFIWMLAVISTLALPALSIALPRWQLPLVELASPAVSAPVADRLEPTPAPRVSRTRHADRGIEQTAPLTSSTDAAEPVRTSVLPTSPAGWIVLIWAAGALAVVGRLLIGVVAVQWMSRRTARVVDAPWLPLAVELARDLGVSRQITFAESPSASMPMAVGIVRPSVLMPADAVRWPMERLRIVLLHELAHVKRRDCLTHAIAQLACAAHWCNPLVWIAARHIRMERERACDDLVLACGTNGPDYAEGLLEIARVMRGSRFPSLTAGATLAMAHRSQLEGRLMAILDPKIPRSGLSAMRVAFAAALSACALLPIASVQPWTIAQASELESVGVVNAAMPEAIVEQLPTPTPTPAPTPTPNPNPNPSHDGLEAARHIGAETATIVQSAVDSATLSAIQSSTQTAVQSALKTSVGSLQTVVQEAVTGAVGVAVAFGQENRKADPRTVAALTAALKDTDKDVRETAMQALIQMRDPSIFEPLMEALKDASPDLRERAAYGLGQMRDKRAVEPLIAVLKDSNPGVREAAAQALSQLRDPRAVDALIAALKDENADVRQQAVFALSQLRDRRALAAIGALIKDPDGDVRQQAVFALGQLRDASAIENLTIALRDAKPDVREQAAFALGQIRDPKSVSPLISALKDDHADVRQQAAFALGQIRDKSAVEALVVAVKDPAADVREQVVFALGQIRDPRAIDALTDALKDTSRDVRQQAAFALGQISR